jgi:hypothetical protein
MLAYQLHSKQVITHRARMGTAQLIAGISSPILQDVNTPLPHLDFLKWIPSLRQFLSTISGSIGVDETTIPLLQRNHDCFLMDYFLSPSKYTPSQLKHLNACRLYLGVTLLSDITIPVGSTLDSWCYNRQQPIHSTYTGLMPYQAYPSPSIWLLWKRALKSLVIPGTLMLRQPLGRWLVSGQQLLRRWRYSYSPNTRELFIFKFSCYKIYEQSRKRDFHYAHRTTQQLPMDSIPVMANLSTSRIIINQRTRFRFFPRSPLPDTFAAFYLRYRSGNPPCFMILNWSMIFLQYPICFPTNNKY